MNDRKIETIAVGEVNRLIDKHSLMDSTINQNDKIPSWDGEIFLYNNADLKVEHIIGRVPVQIKGKNNVSLLKKAKFSYPVQYRHLKNYYNDGGVFYIVVVMSDNGDEAKLFYNNLTPVKLKYILSNSSNKRPKQTKSIEVKKLKGEEVDDLFKKLRQFHFDRVKQGLGSGEIMKNAIDLENMHKIHRVAIPGINLNNTPELLSGLSKGEICAYGLDSENNIWVPFSYEFQSNLEFYKGEMINKPVIINGKTYYDEINILRNQNSDFIFEFSENLVINANKGEITFNVISAFDNVKNDLEFLKAIKEYQDFNLYIGEYDFGRINNVNLDNLDEILERLSLMIDAFDFFHIACNKRIDAFTEENWHEIGILIKVYLNRDLPQNNYSVVNIKWDDKIYPVVLSVNSHRPYCHSLLDTNLKVYTNKKYIVPPIIQLQKETLIKLYEFSDDIMMETLYGINYCPETNGYLIHLFLELLSAYDETSREIFYTMADYIIERVSSYDTSYTCLLNKLQLKKRKQCLNDDDIGKLENIINYECDVQETCAANILLENKYNAKKLLNAMSCEDRKQFEGFPIYNLL